MRRKVRESKNPRFQEVAEVVAGEVERLYELLPELFFQQAPVNRGCLSPLRRILPEKQVGLSEEGAPVGIIHRVLDTGFQRLGDEVFREDLVDVSSLLPTAQDGNRSRLVKCCRLGTVGCWLGRTVPEVGP